MRTALCLVALAALSLDARAQCGTTSKPDLVSTSPVANEFFGETVRSDGARAIVGAYGRDTLGTDSGTAYVYRLDPGGWVFEAQLFAPDANATDHFGRSAAVSGEWAFVGSYQDDDGGSNSGSAHFFRRSGTSWSHFQKVVAFDPAATDRFGRVIGLRGDVAVAGAPFDDDLGVDVGSAYVFRWSGTAWLFEQKLVPSDGVANDRFGKQFALGENLIVTGASIHGLVGAPEAGQGYVYRFDGSVWNEEARLAPPMPQTNERMGVSTGVTGTLGSEVAVIGASDWDDGALQDCGTAYVFRRVGGAWTFEAQLLASDRQAQDNFGWTVAIEGDTILVGAQAEDAPSANNAGAAYVFRRQGGAWIEVEKLVAPVREAGEQVGISIELAGGQALLGANVADVGATVDAGRVVVFEVQPRCIEPFCIGDGSGTACPCGNASAIGAGAGCLNSLGIGGKLVALGVASVSADSIVLTGSSMPDSSALYFQGESAVAGGLGTVFGDGLRCAGSPVVRLGTKVNVTGTSSYPVAGDLSISVKGAVPPGAMRYYQVRYRDNPAFCTVEMFNQTNGVQVTWIP